MRINLALWLGMVLLALGSWAAQWAPTASSAGAAIIEAQRHFRALLPPQPVDILNVIWAAQSLDYWIRIQTGLNVVYLKGQRPCTACDPLQEAQFFVPPQLYVDGQHFWIRLDEESWQLALRPARELPTRYELIVSPKLPKTTLNPEDVSAIVATLRPFGVIPSQTESFSLEPLIPPAKPEPPEGVRIDSVLYGLITAPDWKAYALQNGIELSGLRARVLVELEAGASLPEGLDLVVEERAAERVRVQALIHRLEELAKDPAVAFVRLPSRPQSPSP